jgi:UDPglucose--hexose-1-phosphate uridylyltransferase
MPELRKDPVIGRWVIVTTERGTRPSEFVQARQPPGRGFCPLCEGNENKTPPEVLAIRGANTLPNTPGWLLRVLPNKFPALRLEGELREHTEGIYEKITGVGTHEVIVETPSHEATLSSLSAEAMTNILIAYRDRIIDLSRDPRLHYIMVFKNHGASAGASLEHSHSQIIALPIIPKRVQEEIAGARQHHDQTGKCIFCDMISQEQAEGTRVVTENQDMLAITPFASRFPFETWILPKKHNANYIHSTEDQLSSLGSLLLSTLQRIDRVLSQPSYNYVLHTDSPGNENTHQYHWHLEIMPRLTRVAGFEWGTGFYINPAPPEEAARFLRECEG